MSNAELIAEALQVQQWVDEGQIPDDASAVLIAKLATALERESDPSQVGEDEHHSIEELYDYRMLYNAHAAHGWHADGIPVVKSFRHYDGEECFGGGWFIVVAELPTGQVSNHYREGYWDLFEVPEVELAPEWDGHTPAVAAERLRMALLLHVLGAAEGGF